MKRRPLLIIIIVIIVLSFITKGNSGETIKEVVPVETKVETEATLQENYNKHKNYIWYVCQEGLKLIDGGPYNFEGPTNAWESEGKFIVRGTNNGKTFDCEYVPYNNKWGMNLNDVRYE